MAKLPMKRVEIYGLKTYRKSILEALQRYGVLEPISVDLSEDGFEKNGYFVVSGYICKS